jgi:hypothetical protein
VTSEFGVVLVLGSDGGQQTRTTLAWQRGAGFVPAGLPDSATRERSPRWV